MQQVSKIPCIRFAASVKISNIRLGALDLYELDSHPYKVVNHRSPIKKSPTKYIQIEKIINDLLSFITL